ncbi:MAG: uS8 family ribosomal protein [Candidatus Paceibacterota bacterium]
MSNDAIADTLNRIYTNALVGNRKVSVPFNKMTESIAQVLQSEGFIESFSKAGKKVSDRSIEINISYIEEEDERGVKNKPKAVIKGFSRVSKPSKRVYARVKDIKTGKKDRATRVFSTPQGVLSESKAREIGVGGELLFEIW